MQYEEIMMREALLEAQKAETENEVPIGAIITHKGEIIARGHNKRENSKNALSHAEIEAINIACQTLGGWRLPECDIFVTLEPCPMCAGAIINSRINRVFFGAYDKKAGSLGSVVDLSKYPYNHKFEVHGGIMEKECANILSSFFKKLR